MSHESCRASGYSLQCYPNNDPGVPFSVLVGASGSHRTSGYGPFFQRLQDANGVPVFAFLHERIGAPDLEMMTVFEVSFAFASKVDVKSVKVMDAHGENTVTVHNLPSILASCSA